MEGGPFSLPGAVSLIPKPVIDGWRELSYSVRSWLGSAVRDISFLGLFRVGNFSI